MHWRYAGCLCGVILIAVDSDSVYSVVLIPYQILATMVIQL